MSKLIKRKLGNASSTHVAQKHLVAEAEGESENEISSTNPSSPGQEQGELYAYHVLIDIAIHVKECLRTIGYDS